MDHLLAILNDLLEFLSFSMLIMGLLLSTARTVQQMIPYYQLQCVGLAGVTLITALELYQDKFQLTIVGLFVIIPILLAFFIEPLLAQATVPENVPYWQRLLRSFTWSLRAKAREEAMPAWLRKRRSRRGLWYLALDLVLTALAFITAYALSGSPYMVAAAENNPVSGVYIGAGISPSVLAVSFSLLLLGLASMVGAEDIISQVMGLLVMEQGMFLAAVRVITSLSMRVYFVTGLFVYIIITLTILVFLLPELHQTSGSLDIDQQTKLKG